MATKKSQSQPESSLGIQIGNGKNMINFTWDLIIKLIMQVGAVGVISVLLILGFQSFVETQRESQTMYREEVKDFRVQLEKQREHDAKMQDMQVKTLELMAKKMEFNSSILVEALKEFKSLKAPLKPCN